MGRLGVIIFLPQPFQTSGAVLDCVGRLYEGLQSPSTAQLGREAHGWGARGDGAHAPPVPGPPTLDPPGRSSLGTGIPSDQAGWFHSPVP